MRTKGAKGKVDFNDLKLANDVRCYIKKNDINLNVLTHRLGMRNSCIYYFMQENYLL